jgi:hypothetical protein
VIAPYRYEGTWVFDEPMLGLQKEPFVSGVPEMIDYLVKDVPNANDKGFRMTFSDKPFPGHQKKLTWVRAETGGNVYRIKDPATEGWLRPAMFKYFSKTPKAIYVKADAKS